MKKVKIACVALNQTPLDFHENKIRHEKAIERAYENSCDIVIFPEMSITGYGCDDAWLYKRVLERSWRSLLSIAKNCRDIICTVGLPVEHKGAVYNCVAVIVNQKIVGLVAKQNLAGDGLHYEPRWFKPWPSGTNDVHEGIPIGDIKFDMDYLTIGFEICEDAWVANRTGATLGTDIIINPSASHTQFDKPMARVNMVTQASKNFSCVYAYANLLGNSSGRAIYDGDRIIANNGDLIADGERFVFRDVVMTNATVDIDIGKLQRRRTFTVSDELNKTKTVNVHLDYYGNFNCGDNLTEPIKPKEYDKNIHFKHAITLGMFDYMRKSKTSGFAISLSGGADSSICAILAYEMILKAALDLKKDFIHSLTYQGFWGGSVGTKFFLNEKIRKTDNMDDIIDFAIENLITCIYQPNEGISSDTTRNAAKNLSSAIGCKYFEIPIKEAVDFYEKQLETYLGRELCWTTDDIVRQNIQARVRAPGAWMIANTEGKLLISTSNRSEAGVGYATMDGDTAGSLSPITGVDKEFILQWLKWYKDNLDSFYTHHIHNEKLRDAVEAIIVQDPTAELRPPDQSQVDEKDLMPYPILKVIEYEAILNGRSIYEIRDILVEKFPNVDKINLVNYTDKFFSLWTRNQWKRERYAPGFHIDHLSLDPKTYCRFPILSGGLK